MGAKQKKGLSKMAVKEGRGGKMDLRDHDDSSSRAERQNPFKSERYKSLTKRLDQIHSHYANMKVALRDDPGKPDLGLSMISDTLPREMMAQFEPSLAALKKAANVNEDQTSGNLLVDDSGLSIGERRKKLKYGGFDDSLGMSHR